MKIIDLSQPLYDKMPVYPGDPEVSIQEIHNLKKEGWNLRLLTFTTHIGTHVNAPYHMAKSGKTLDDLPLERFFGKAVLNTQGMTFDKNIGVIFHSQNIDSALAQQLMQSPSKFVGLSAQFEFDLTVERLLCENNIISFENLINTDKLPASFMFYAVPLKIKGGEGSPVRAFAIGD
ncbi:cyclase family protein [Candidatus Roizmanbacteria bacterium]|nr:cyclase family protein [Candidatus Roizmanbacteria bacterium]